MTREEPDRQTGGQGKTETETDRQTGGQGKTETETDRQTDRQTGGQGKTETETDRQTNRRTGKDRDRDRQTDKQADRDRQRQTDRQRDRDIKTGREKEGGGEGVVWWSGDWAMGGREGSGVNAKDLNSIPKQPPWFQREVAALSFNLQQHGEERLPNDGMSSGSPFPLKDY